MQPPPDSYRKPRVKLPPRRRKEKEIKDPAEYNAYVNAIQQQDPNAKAQALEAFIQTYPNSVMKIDAAEQLMAAYQQAGNAQKMIDAANRILQMDPNNVRALAILTYTYRATITAQNLQQNLPLIQKYATQGEQALPNLAKPEGMSDADFTKLHNELGAIFEGGLGFVALQNKRPMGTRVRTSGRPCRKRARQISPTSIRWLRPTWKPSR